MLNAEKNRIKRRNLKILLVFLVGILMCLTLTVGMKYAYTTGYNAGTEDARDVITNGSGDKSPVVYVTESGEKYHRSYCRTIQGSEKSE